MNLFGTNPLPKWLAVALLVLAAIGVLDAGYLTVTHYTGASTICYSLTECDQVLQSQYAMVFGVVPLALIGLLYYAALLTLLILYLRKPRTELWYAIMGILTFAFLVSLILVYLQFFVIHALCVYCLISATLTTLSFLAMGLGTFNMYLELKYPSP